MTEPTDKQLLDEVSADEQQLDEYLKGDSSVSRQYRQLHGADVPTQLDRLVLREAEDAVKRRPLQGRPTWMRWTAPLAVAASAVLVLSIVIETGVRDETVSEVSREISRPGAAQPTMQAKQRERSESKAEEAIVSEVVVPLVPVQELVSPTYAPAVPPPPPVQVERPAPESRMNFQSPAEPPRAAMRARPSAPPPVAAPAPDVSASPQSVTAAAEMAARELRSGAADDATKKSSADDVAKDRGVAPEREEESAAGVAAFSRRINAERSAPAYSDPEAWLQDIRALRKENKQEEADREWQRFRDAFPNYEVAETDLAREAKK